MLSLSLSFSQDNYFTLPKNEASKNAVIFLLNHHPNIQPNFENINGLLIYPKIKLSFSLSDSTRLKTKTKTKIQCQYPNPSPTRTRNFSNTRARFDLNLKTTRLALPSVHHSPDPLDSCPTGKPPPFQFINKIYE